VDKEVSLQNLLWRNSFSPVNYVLGARCFSYSLCWQETFANLNHIGMKIHKGDTVKIISGNDKGKQGKVIAVFPRGGKIVVEGVNIKKKHVRPRGAGKKGELVRVPAPLVASRAALVCPQCGKPVRIGYRLQDGKKGRACKKCGAEL